MGEGVPHKFPFFKIYLLASSLSIINSQIWLEFMSIESVMPFNHLILCRPLLLLPSIFLSIRVFSNESLLRIKWPKYWNLSFSISPSDDCSGLYSFRMDWLDIFPVQKTPKSLLQHYSSKSSILWHTVFFMVQLSHPRKTTGKTTASNIWTLVRKVISVLFNMLSRFVIASSKEQESFNFRASVLVYSVFETQENKICHCFHPFPLLFVMRWWDQKPWS